MEQDTVRSRQHSLFYYQGYFCPENCSQTLKSTIKKGQSQTEKTH